MCGQVSFGGQTQFAEVRFYFTMHIEDIEHALAVVSLYSQPDLTMLVSSSNTMVSCVHQDNAGLAVISVRSILAGITMVPHTIPTTPAETRYFVVEKMGLDITLMDGIVEVTVDEE